MISRSGIEVYLLQQSTGEPYPQLDITSPFISDPPTTSEVVSVPDRDAFSIRVVVSEKFDWRESDVLQVMICYGKRGSFYRFPWIRKPETPYIVIADFDHCSVWNVGTRSWQNFSVQFFDAKVRRQKIFPISPQPSLSSCSSFCALISSLEYLHYCSMSWLSREHASGQWLLHWHTWKNHASIGTSILERDFYLARWYTAYTQLLSPSVTLLTVPEQPANPNQNRLREYSLEKSRSWMVRLYESTFGSGTSSAWDDRSVLYVQWGMDTPHCDTPEYAWRYPWKNNANKIRAWWSYTFNECTSNHPQYSVRSWCYSR